VAPPVFETPADETPGIIPSAPEHAMIFFGVAITTSDSALCKLPSLLGCLRAPSAQSDSTSDSLREPVAADLFAAGNLTSSPVESMAMTCDMTGTFGATCLR